jgi:DNA polymerase-3 subunit alpha
MLTKKGEKMCSATLEDRSGKIECIVFPKTFQEYIGFFNQEEVVVMDGTVNLKENPKKFFPRKIRRISEVSEERVGTVEINANLTDIGVDKLKRLKELIMLNPGTKPLILYFQSEKGKARMVLGKEFLINPNPKLVLKINELFNKNSVRLVVNLTQEKTNGQI